MRGGGAAVASSPHRASVNCGNAGPGGWLSPESWSWWSWWSWWRWWRSAAHCAERRGRGKAGQVCREPSFTQTLSRGDVQTVVLELGVCLHFGHPPGRAPGSGRESAHAPGGAAAGAVLSLCASFLFGPWLRELEWVSDAGYSDIFCATVLVILSYEHRLKDTPL